jgi:hypothetical protein
MIVLAFAFSLTAQDAPATQSEASAQTAPAAVPVAYSMFVRGDSLLTLQAGTTIGLGFYSGSSGFSASTMKPGFVIGLSYQMFANESWAFGGELSGSFLTTVRNRSFFMMPIAAKATYAIDIQSFIISPTVSLGIAISSVDALRNTAPYARLGSAFSWRANSDVSYSLNLGFAAVPQFYADTTQNLTGFFMDAALSATYHL